MKSNMEFVHNDLYGVALEICKKWVSKSEIRPILNYTKHSKDGSIYATDSHRLITIKDVHGFKEDYLVNPKTFMFAKGKFPNIESLLSDEDYEEAIELTKDQIKIWLQLFKSINQTLKVMKDNAGSMKLLLEENKVIAVLENYGVNIELPTNIYVKQKTDKITLNVEYMRDALEAHKKMGSDKLTIKLRGQMRPVILDDTKMVKTLVLPLRTY